MTTWIKRSVFTCTLFASNCKSKIKVVNIIERLKFIRCIRQASKQIPGSRFDVTACTFLYWSFFNRYFVIYSILNNTLQQPLISAGKILFSKSELSGTEHKLRSNSSIKNGRNTYSITLCRCVSAISKRQSNPTTGLTGLEGSRNLRLPDFKSRHMKVVRLSALRTGRFTPRK